jgi:glycosyltransferase involved in cell wall biosynthesis
MTRQLRLAIVRDYRAEGWLSMDLCADQLLAHWPPSIAVVEVAPPFYQIFGRLPLWHRSAFNADRFINRYWLLPRVVRKMARQVDFVHIVDHSYAHLVHAVPPGRAGVYCHDLDAFRSLLEPEKEPRPAWFRRLARHILEGLQRAAVVFCNSQFTASGLLTAGIVPAQRLVHAPLGIAREFTPEPPPYPVPLPQPLQFPYLLHVGKNVPRKRLDVLIEVFAAVRPRFPNLRVIQVGGPWPPALARRIEQLQLTSAIVQWRGLSREQLAELYRRAAIVLVPSQAEGFGLPVIEALACGSVVIASDLPSLREAGGAAALYCPVADVATWADTVTRVLADPTTAPPRPVRLARAARFSWTVHARIIADVYQRLGAY